MKKIIIVLACCILTVIIIIGFRAIVTKGGTEGVANVGEEEFPPLEIKAVIADSGDVLVWVDALARIKSAKRREFLSPSNTTVLKVFVKEGDRVNKGDYLIKLKDDAEKATYEKAYYEFEKAKKKHEFAMSRGNENSMLLRVTTGLTDAEERFAKAKSILECLDIKSPFAGIVEYVNKQAGSSINKGEKVISVYSNKELYALAKVPQVEIGGITRGNHALVRAIGRDDVEQGRVISVSPVIGEKSTGTVKISLAKNWMIGEVVEVEIVKEMYKNRVRVPVAAVLFREGRYCVFKVKESIAKWQWIKKGVDGRDFIEIIEGVSPGDTILFEGQFTIAHNTPVTVIVE